MEIRLVVVQATRLFRPATRRTAGAVIQANGDGLFATLLAAVPVGGSPTGAGGSPAPPIFKTGSSRRLALISGSTAMPGLKSRAAAGRKANVIRVLVTEDHTVVRDGLVAIIKQEADMDVVAETGDGQQAAELWKKHRPDITLMDLRRHV